MNSAQARRLEPDPGPVADDGSLERDLSAWSADDDLETAPPRRHAPRFLVLTGLASLSWLAVLGLAVGGWVVLKLL